jgi:hypothetical protein
MIQMHRLARDAEAGNERSRNAVNVLSSQVVMALPALAVKLSRMVEVERPRERFQRENA